MKIGFFTDGYFPKIDGVAYTLTLWRDRLEAAGHEVWIVYPNGEYAPQEREIPVRSLPNPFYPGYRLPLWKRTASLPDFDIVHCHSPGPLGLLGLRYARKYDLPAVYTHHTPIEEYFHQSLPVEAVADVLSAGYVPIENRVLEQFDIVTASTGQIDRSVDAIRLPVGVDMELFSPRETPAHDGSALVGYSGRISMEKNVSDILAVARERPDYDFVIVGEGPQREAVEADAPANVTLRDFLPRAELPEYYASLDAFVTASTADTLGLATLEANACGTPVVAPDVPPFSETIGSENGIRYSYGDIDGMAAALDSCLDRSWNPRSAIEPYSVDRTIDELQSLYNSVSSL
jgi:glycosyltransferase involved in cell wall biosynthesis